MFVAASPPGENNWWVAKLYLQNVGGGPIEFRKDERRLRRTPKLRLWLQRRLSTCDLRPVQSLRPTPRPPDRRPPLLPRRQADRLHRRHHVRPGLHRRRHLPHSRDRPRTQLSSPPTSPPTALHPPPTSPGSTTTTSASPSTPAAAPASPHSTCTTGKDVPGLAVTLPETIIAGTDAMSVSVAAHSLNIAHDPRILLTPTRGLGRPHRQPPPDHPPQRLHPARLGQSRIDRLHQRRLPHPGLAHLPRGWAERRATQKISAHRQRPRRSIQPPSRRAGPPRPTAPSPSPRSATSSSCPTRAAASARAKNSPRPTSKTSATAISPTSSPASICSKGASPSTSIAKASPAGATADS